MIKQPEGLINVLLDKTAREDERDDAAMDLARYPSDKTIEALYKIAIDETEDDLILDSCGESLVKIWVSINKIDKIKIKNLSKIAHHSARSFIKVRKPEWLGYFEE